jgi:hypothetical protein
MNTSISSPRHRAVRAIGAAALAVGLAAGASIASVAPAQAAVAKTFISTPNGMVGLAQNVVIKAPKLKGQAVSVTFTSGATSAVLQTTINPLGFGSITWTPASAGSWTISGTGTLASAGSTTIIVTQMPTSTTLLVPNQTRNGVAANAVITVTAPIGTAAPAGTVALNNGFGTQISTAALAPVAGAAQSSATIPWTPGAVGFLPLTAVYTPSSPAFAPSSSPLAQSLASDAAQTVALQVPQTFHVGQPATLTAILGPGVSAGTVAFWLDNKGLSASIATVNGQASYTWTPSSATVQTLSVQFSATNGNSSGTSAQPVNVLMPVVADPITVDPAGSAVWSTTQPNAMTAGASVALAATSGSGTTVVLSENGPCIINGSTLTVLSAGTCTVTATSPGAGTYAPGIQNYTVSITKTLKK